MKVFLTGVSGYLLRCDLGTGPQAMPVINQKTRWKASTAYHMRVRDHR